MIQINKKIVIFSFVFWIFLIQSLFYFHQENSGFKILGAIGNQLRDEYGSSNYLQLSKNLTDYTYLNFIKCAKLEKNGEIIIDLSYMAKKCDSSFFLLNGFKIHEIIKNLNGDQYNLQFISLNSLSFEIALWVSRVIGCLIIFLLYWIYLLDQKNRLSRIENKMQSLETIRNLSIQVAHDIKSPIAVINTLKDNLNNHEKIKIFHDAIVKLNSIADDLLKSDNLEKNHLKIVDLNQLLTEIITQKNVEKNANIKFKKYDYSLIAEINPILFSRIISNLLNNSIEATSDINRNINIELNYLEDSAEISIFDNGKGIPQSILKKIGKIEISSKQHTTDSGNGIGLYSAFHYIEKLKGTIVINSKEKIGTEIKIKIPAKISNLKPKFILIDNDELTRINWKIKAQNSNIELLIFCNKEELYTNLPNIPLETNFYIDNELGDIKGEEIAAKLHLMGYANLYMCTGHPASNFAHLTFLKGVIDKTPPF